MRLARGCAPQKPTHTHWTPGADAAASLEFTTRNRRRQFRVRRSPTSDVQAALAGLGTYRRHTKHQQSETHPTNPPQAATIPPPIQSTTHRRHHNHSDQHPLMHNIPLLTSELNHATKCLFPSLSTNPLNPAPFRLGVGPCLLSRCSWHTDE